MTQEPDTYSALAEVGAPQERRSFWDKLVLDLKKSPWSARFGMLVILTYAMVGIFAPALAPHGVTVGCQSWSKNAHHGIG